MEKPKKLNLSNIPTPVQEIEFKGTRFLIKRDDYTGTELSGNKIRKLDYLLYEAKRRKCNYIFTCGGDQSNHCRATAIAAAALGMKTNLFLWGYNKKHPDGNLFFDKLTGAETTFLSYSEYKKVNDLMSREKDEFEKRGNKAFVIPTGGSNSLGIWGYIDFVEEIYEQKLLNKISGICLAVGSGGTIAGLMLGLAMRNVNIKLYGVNVVDNQIETRRTILSLVLTFKKDYNINVNVNEENLIILDGYSKEGYKKIAKDKVKLLNEFAKSTGIILDPAYTGKAFFAYHENFLHGKQASNVLFLHTGGIFGVFPKKKIYLSV